MLRPNKILSLLAALALAVAASAQVTQPLSLEDCRKMALGNNIAIKKATYQKQKASETRQEAFTKYFPQISAQAFAFRANENIIEMGVMDILTLSFLRGGHGAGVQVLQPIFMGGQIVNGNKLAVVGETVADLQRQQSRREVIQTVDTYFWQIASLEAQAGTLKSATRMVDSLLYTVQAAHDVGIITYNDVLEVQIKRRQLLADSIDLQNGLRLCQMVLAQYIGADTARITTTYEPFAKAPEIPVTVYTDPTQAVYTMPQYKMLQQGVEAAKLERRMAFGKLLPMVAGGGGYMHQTAMGANHGFWIGYIGVSVPISDWWGGTHAVRQKKVAELEAQTRLEDDSQLLRISVQKAWDDLTAAQRKAALAQEAIGQAEENMRIYQAMYDAGTTTITDLLQAQTLHRQACDALTQACAAYQLSLGAYLVATSQLE